jgi:CRISPR-associated protein Cas1
MLNEFAYCPRLAYLEWVQGEFADNLETIQGRFAHRRVDRADRKDLPEEKGGRGKAEGGGEDIEVAEVETFHSRSLMLSAPEEGLIARMDVVDISAGEAVPVDYKRGRVPDVPGGAWEPEQVQLCAQGLILRANGYHCEGGILYYAESRRRVTIPFDEPLIQRTRQLVGDMRRMAASGRMPPPLDDSPKCPRCSLVGICLPDETGLLSCTDDHRQQDVRRLMPARDDALPLYVQEQGTTVGKSGDQLTVKRRKEVVRKVKLIDVSQVCVFGSVQVTSQALRELSAGGIPLCHFSYGGWFHAMTVGMAHKNVELRIAQFQAASETARSLDLARQFIVGKIKNSRTLIRRHLRNEAKEFLQPLTDLLEKAKAVSSAMSLLGIEGMAAKTHFAAFARMLKGADDFNIEGRNRRPPRDPTNALLSFVYAMLVKELTIAVHTTGLDPMLGFFHRPRYGRPSWALDLAGEFRPLVGDSVVLTLINNGEVSPSSFIRRAGGIALTDAGRRAVLAGFERRLDTLVTHPVFGYRISYRRVFEVQVRLLARVLSGEIKEYPSFCTR